MSDATSRLIRECRLLAPRNVIVSTNVAVRRDGLPYAHQKTPEGSRPLGIRPAAMRVRHAASDTKATRVLGRADKSPRRGTAARRAATTVSAHPPRAPGETRQRQTLTRVSPVCNKVFLYGHLPGRPPWANVAELAD